MTRVTLILAFAGSVVVLSAQAPPPIGPVFEVASVKPSTTTPTASTLASPDRFIRSANTVRQLVQFAYERPAFLVIGGPEWVGSETFDVNAKALLVPTPNEMRTMVRRLLADRFQLKTSTAIREMPIYFMRLARDDRRLGLQLTPTTVDCAAVEADRRRKGESAPTRSAAGPQGRPVCTTWVSGRPIPNGVAVRYQSSGTTGTELAAWLVQYVGRPIVDDTTLSGDFDIDLSFSPPSVPSPSATSVDETAMLFTALDQQLGLKLEPARAPVEVLVIDSVERPTPD